MDRSGNFPEVILSLVIVAMPHKLTSNMAAAKATATDSLEEIPENISISFLPNHKSLADRILKKGLNYFTQGYIHNIRTYAENRPKIRVIAKCWRSMRKSEKPHSVQIEVEQDKITESHCTCMVGLTGHCSHVIGLIKSLQGLKLHDYKNVPDLLSCTSLPQQWHVPRGEKITPVPVNHLVVAKPSESRKRKPVLCQFNTQEKLPKVTADDIVQLQKASGTPLEYILSAQAPVVNTPLGEVQLGSFLSYQTRNLRTVEVSNTAGCGNVSVNRTAPVKLPERFQSLTEQYSVTDPENLESSTRMQADCTEWHRARTNRLTASNFGQILFRKAAPNEKMLSRLFSSEVINAAPLTYGKKNERKAISKYLSQFPGRHVHECGFVVNNSFPFLGATPDGKLCDNGEVGIIEVKCPYSARDITVIEACSEIQNFFLQKDENGNISLQENHSYYAQVQGQLMITGCSFCDFIVYCPNQSDLFVQRISPDINFMERLLFVLSNFFEKYALPYLKRND